MNGEAVFATVAIWFVVFLMVVLGVFIIGIMVSLVLDHFTSKGCDHSWDQWGDPVKDEYTPNLLQARICKKCRMIERRLI